MQRVFLVSGIAVLVVLLGGASALAQSESPFLWIGYAKSTGDGDVIQIENEVWKPVFEEAVKDGLLHAWWTYRVWNGFDGSYDIVYMQMFENLSDMDGSNEQWAVAWARAHPDKDMAEEGNRAAAARSIVKSEIWRVHESVGDPHGRFVSVGFMKVPPGGAAAYRAAESEIAKPLFEVLVADGAQTGWGMSELVFPGGAEYPYQFITPNFYSDLDSITAPKVTDERTARAFPDADVDALSARLMGSRTMVRTELWEMVAHAH